MTRAQLANTGLTAAIAAALAKYIVRNDKKGNRQRHHIVTQSEGKKTTEDARIVLESVGIPVQKFKVAGEPNIVVIEYNFHTTITANPMYWSAIWLGFPIRLKGMPHRNEVLTILSSWRTALSAVDQALINIYY